MKSRAILCLCLAGLFAAVLAFAWLPAQPAQAATPISPPAGTHFVITSFITNINVATPCQFTVTVVDGNNNPVSGYSGTVHFSDYFFARGTVSATYPTGIILPPDAEIADGTGIFTETPETSGVLVITATDKKDSSITGISGFILVSQGQPVISAPLTTPSYFIVALPGSAVAGEPVECAVAAVNEYDNSPPGCRAFRIISNYHCQLVFSSADKNASLPANPVLNNGSGTFSLTFNTLGRQSITVTQNYNGANISVDDEIQGTSNATAVEVNPAVRLRALSVSSGSLSPKFNANTTAYKDSIAGSVSSITVTPTTADPGSTVTVNGVPAAGGQASGALSMSVGKNEIPIVVTSQDGTLTQAYTVAVTRAAPAQSPAGTTAPTTTQATAKTVLVFTIGSTSYSVNGQPFTMVTAPVIAAGRTLLPITYVAVPLGAAVDWNQAQRMATVTLGAQTIQLVIGQDTAEVNGASVPIDPANPAVAPVIDNGRTVLPLAFIAKNLGCQVAWNSSTQSVTVTYPAS